MRAAAAVAAFAVGYVAGTRAGRERYAQMLDGCAKASQRLEEFSVRHRTAGRDAPRAERRP